MNIQKLSTKLIKPIVPTPPTLRHYKTSFIDEFVPYINISAVVFFSPNSNHNLNFVSQLEKSLEKTLTRFYPLCGRYVDETHTVDCNDEGAEFIHAKVNIKLQDILAPQLLDVKFVDEFIPSKMGAIDQFSDPLLATQVTMFECGGVAIGVSAAHKIIDASSLSTFVSYWAAMNREDINEVDIIGPGFSSSLLFPGRCFREIPLKNISDDMSSKYIRKRFSFGESVISKMKANAIANGNTNTRYYSKVQLVSAIIWKALIDVDRATNINPRESMLLQPVNLRGKMASSIPTHSYGNLWVFCPTEAGSLETTSRELGYRLTDNVKKTINNYSKVYHDSEEGQTMVLNSYSQANVIGLINVIAVSSWCKFSFYEADFGFGKPTWVAPGCVPLENSIFLLDDARGTGVDAHILLNVKAVPKFKEALEKEVNSFVA